MEGVKYVSVEKESAIVVGKNKTLRRETKANTNWWGITTLRDEKIWESTYIYIYIHIYE